MVAPLAVKVVELPEQILVAFGVTVKLNGGLKLTLMDAVAVPQVPTATTYTVPAEAPKLTVIALVPAPAVIEAPAGTVQV